MISKPESFAELSSTEKAFKIGVSLMALGMTFGIINYFFSAPISIQIEQFAQSTLQIRANESISMFLTMAHKLPEFLGVAAILQGVPPDLSSGVSAAIYPTQPTNFLRLLFQIGTNVLTAQTHDLLIAFGAGASVASPILSGTEKPKKRRRRRG